MQKIQLQFDKSGDQIIRLNSVWYRTPLGYHGTIYYIRVSQPNNPNLDWLTELARRQDYPGDLPSESDDIYGTKTKTQKAIDWLINTGKINSLGWVFGPAARVIAQIVMPTAIAPDSDVILQQIPCERDVPCYLPPGFNKEEHKGIIDNNELHKIRIGDKHAVNYLTQLGYDASDYTYKLLKFYAQKDLDSNSYSNFLEFEFIKYENTQTDRPTPDSYRDINGIVRNPR